MGSRVNGLAQAHAETLPFPSESFDAVVLTEVIEHVDDPDAVLAEARRVLKPDGRCLVSAPNERLINRLKRIVTRMGLGRILMKELSPRMDRDWHLHVFDSESFRDLIGRHFRVEEFSRAPGCIFPVRFVVSAQKEHRETLE